MSSCTIGPKLMVKKDRKHMAKEKAVFGFDYPISVVGASTWKGSDDKPVTVYYDPHTGAAGLFAARTVLSKIDDIMKSCDDWFGARGAGGNIIVASFGGGAYHFGCDFVSGGDWYLDPADGNDATVGLAMAEICESYMGIINGGFDCGGSGGEALSRFLSEIATGGAGGAMLPYSSATSYDGANWIDKDQGTDGDYPSIGCGVLYLWWMATFRTVEQIVQAGEPDGTLASNYAKLTGKHQSQAWTDFQDAVAPLGLPANFANDNPFKAPTPPFPASAPTPPTPPPATDTTSRRHHHHHHGKG